MYADDTCLYSRGKSVEIIEEKLNVNLSHANKWMKSNKMVLNSEKTKCMLITTVQKSRRLSRTELELNLDGVNIEPVFKEKLLGMEIDNFLTFNKLVSSLCSKVSLRILALRRIKRFLPNFARKIFYNALILPYFNYCISVWSSCNASSMDRVFKLQKMAARIILDVNSISSIRSSELFKQLNWISLPSLAKYSKTVMVFKALNNMSPPYITEMFLTNTAYRTRGQCSNLLQLPRARTEKYKRSFIYSASDSWNKLPPHIRKLTCFSSFKLESFNFFKSKDF
jgi:hypothetical protein